MEEVNKELHEHGYEVPIFVGYFCGVVAEAAKVLLAHGNGEQSGTRLQFQSQRLEPSIMHFERIDRAEQHVEVSS